MVHQIAGFLLGLIGYFACQSFDLIHFIAHLL